MFEYNRLDDHVTPLHFPGLASKFLQKYLCHYLRECHPYIEIPLA